MVFKLLTEELIMSVAQQAKANPRLRQNYNFHESDESVQRFLNVLQPGTYVRPHCHAREGGFEFFLVLQGSLGFLVMDEQGKPLAKERLTPQGEVRGLELLPFTYHTLVALAPNTTILEVKSGPYNPQNDKQFLTMFPAEGTPEAKQWVHKWANYF